MVPQDVQIYACGTFALPHGDRYSGPVASQQESGQVALWRTPGRICSALSGTEHAAVGVEGPGCLPILRCTGILFYPKPLDKWHERVHVCDLYSIDLTAQAGTPTNQHQTFTVRLPGQSPPCYCPDFGKWDS